MIRTRRTDRPALSGRLRLIVLAVVIGVAAASCGGSAAEEEPATSATTLAAAPTTVAASTAAPTTAAATTTTTAGPDPAPTSTGAADVVALGEELYQRTAGGIGCQACHGTDGLGDVGPAVIGKDAATIKIQLETNEAMTFIVLSDAEIEAVAAYLAVLQAEFDAGMDG